MRINDFDVYKDLLYEKSGLTLTPDKSYLLDSRLTPIAKKWGYANLETMTMALHGVADPNLIKDIIEAMTTNETSFFRDTRPFDTFKNDVLPPLVQARGSIRKIRIWCAAASSGQEPYSLAMVLKENEALLKGFRFEILATDISTEILDQAKTAEYTQFEVQRGLPIQMLMKYFEQKEDKWALKDEIKNMITFKYFNLLDNIAALGQFDVIFCRNVLIYFDKETKKRVLDNMSKILSKDGYLFLGGAETVMGITDSFEAAKDKRGLYVHKGIQDNAAEKQQSAAAAQ